MGTKAPIVPTYRYATINETTRESTTCCGIIESDSPIVRYFLVPDWGHRSTRKPDTWAEEPDGVALPLTDQSLSHEHRDDRLPVHYSAAIDHTQYLLEGM